MATKRMNREDWNMNNKEIKRDEIDLQHFMDDMMLISKQVNDRNLRKPTSFNYGSLEITNYLLWLCLAELMILNNKNKV